MNELIKINSEGKTTAKELYEFLNLHPAAYSRWCKSNIDDNDFADEGIDYFPFNMNVECGGQASTNYYLSVPFAKKLCMLSKSERGEQARNYFIEVERRYKEERPQLTQIQVLAEMARQMAEQEQMMLSAAANASTALKQVDFIRDTIIRRNDENWREQISIDLNAIVKASGGTHQDVRSESYELLEDRAACRLSVRVANARDRLREAGAKKTAIEKYCKLDAIEEDSKLKEIYTGIVKEMAICHLGRQ